jgi:hypothetical protein
MITRPPFLSCLDHLGVTDHAHVENCICIRSCAEAKNL